RVPGGEKQTSSRLAPAASVAHNDAALVSCRSALAFHVAAIVSAFPRLQMAHLATGASKHWKRQHARFVWVPVCLGRHGREKFPAAPVHECTANATRMADCDN